MRFWHKIKMSNPQIFQIWWFKCWIFQTYNIWSNRIHSLKYQRFTTLGKKDMGLKNQSLRQKLNSFAPLILEHEINNRRAMSLWGQKDVLVMSHEFYCLACIEHWSYKIILVIFKFAEVCSWKNNFKTCFRDKLILFTSKFL